MKFLVDAQLPRYLAESLNGGGMMYCIRWIYQQRDKVRYRMLPLGASVATPTAILAATGCGLTPTKYSVQNQ